MKDARYWYHALLMVWYFSRGNAEKGQRHKDAAREHVYKMADINGGTGDKINVTVTLGSEGGMEA